jgi:uncharacterized membrane protein HdeD (DUF308 family)
MQKLLLHPAAAGFFFSLSMAQSPSAYNRYGYGSFRKQRGNLQKTRKQKMLPFPRASIYNNVEKEKINPYPVDSSGCLPEKRSCHMERKNKKEEVIQQPKKIVLSWTILVCISAAYIIGGALLLIFPQVSLPMLCQALGILLVITGAVFVLVYFLRKRYLVPGHFEFAGGAACILLGIFSLIRTNEVACAFRQLLSIAVLADSLIKMQYSTDLLRLRMKRWWIVLIMAGVSTGLAMTALTYSFGSDAAQLTFTYSTLIADGILNIIVICILRHAHKTYQIKSEQELENTAELDPSELSKPKLPI